MSRAARDIKLVTVADHVHSVAKRLSRAGVVFAHGTTDPVAEAAFLVGEAMQLHPDRVEAFASRKVGAAAAKQIEEWTEARIATRKPAAYIVNKMYMLGVPFYVDERVIVPRSFLGEVLQRHFSDSDAALIGDPSAIGRVLDLCTGSGCLAILAAQAFPNATIDAVDLSADALDVAARNVADHQLGGRITLHQGDAFAPLGSARYDLIISNPPYVDAEGMAGLPRECRHEPAVAFDGGADGLDIIRRIVDSSPAHLTAHGGLLCEVGRCKPALDAAYPDLPLLWLDTEESEGEVFWIGAEGFSTPPA